MNRLLKPVFAFSLFAAFSGEAIACGPFFPDSYLENPTLVLRPPVADPGGEIQRITSWALGQGLLAGPFAPIPRQEKTSEASFVNFAAAQKSTLTTDAQELKEALISNGLPEEKAKSIAEEFRNLRASLTSRLGLAFQQTTIAREGNTERDTTLPPAPTLEWPTEIPQEFRLYAEGARLLANGQTAEAREQWKEILSLPEAERKRRSVWASYMMGRTFEKEEPAIASSWFQKTRELARAGYSDSLQLASASYLREAEIATTKRDWDTMARLLLAQRESGSSNDELIWGLASEVMHSKAVEEEFRRSAEMKVFRQILTARMLPRRFWDLRDFQEKRPLATQWIVALEEKQSDEKIEFADRIAWAAYTHGNFDLAKRWLAVADPGNPHAAWIRAKLQLIDGKPERAASSLQSAAWKFARNAWGTDSFYDYRDYHGRPDQPGSFYKLQFEGDLGIASLGCGKFLPAFEHLLRSGFWSDAAYVGERCLDRVELLKFVRKHFKKVQGAPTAYQDFRSAGSSEADISSNVQHMLARRLARDHYFKDARVYYPAVLLPEFDKYVAAWRLGKNKKQAAWVRVDALWTAALIQRRAGMELFGTELGPDNAWSGGSFGRPSDAENRKSGAKAPVYDEYSFRPDELPDGRRFQLPITAAERDRLRKTRFRFEYRYQYRFEAADLAWEAAHLLPKDNIQGARMLLTAGRWIMYLDPNTADKFYKALIWRNWNLPIAKEADQRRWFPPLSSLPPE